MKFPNAIHSVLCTALALTAAALAGAITIDFEAESAGRGGNLTGIPDSPVTIGIVTFSGGELLRGEVGLNADNTGVYASQGLFGSGETNPLVISFSEPVRDFNLLLLNGDDVRSYSVSDDLGHSVTKKVNSAGSLGAVTFPLSGDAIREVTITSENIDGWDFAIDNVSFTPATVITPTPEPSTLLLSGAALLALGVVRPKRVAALLRALATHA